MPSPHLEAIETLSRYQAKFGLPLEQVRSCGKFVASLSPSHLEQKPVKRLQTDLQSALAGGEPIKAYEDLDPKEKAGIDSLIAEGKLPLREPRGFLNIAPSYFDQKVTDLHEGGPLSWD